MAEFFLEILSEEIPARMQARAADELRRLFAAALTDAGLPHDGGTAHVTPRRLALSIGGMPIRQDDRVEERKGPKVDAPEKAVEGFLRATGLTLDQCEQRETPKGNIWYAVIQKPGRPTAEVLTQTISTVLSGFGWPKSMRWGDRPFRWVRPLRQIVALFDGVVLDGGFEPDARTRFAFGDTTVGHRFMAPGPITVTGMADYAAQLLDAKVVLDRDDRKRLIEDGARARAAEAGLTLRDDPGLIDEVAGLVEWPVALLGHFDTAFLDVPPEVLTTSMRTHQRYFALERPDGTLAPNFVVIANIEAADGGKAVVEGNQRVLQARLSDAKFFWDQDRKSPLASRVPKLSEVTFHARLGTMAEKVDRMVALAGTLAPLLGCPIDQATRAATLAKADLVTGMVGEFPELQGIIGGYYATAEHEDAAVAAAIGGHYAPLGPNDQCPDDPVTAAVALADKLDTLVGFFGIDEKPTGSRDPYALRRAALGIIRITVENGYRLSLSSLFDEAASLYGHHVEAGPDLKTELLAFFADRLKVVLRDSGVRHDLIDAVFAAATEDDLVRLLARVRALESFLKTDDGANLLVAYRRAANIVRIEAKKDGQRAEDYAPVEPEMLTDAAETTLHAAIMATDEQIGPLTAQDRFEDAMTVFAGLRGPVDAFFDTVTVNAEDGAIRRNRLALLQAMVTTMDRVATFSRIEG
ncbi:glycine--tRNA ligase subunit beta [Fodinicurvata sp. EGI_FJ10296]|uniref:glycine--tRNA ligase subunit beta n=1 Tax=Fodinicurvata sp. EGI_FJ10296 TaxID=3231908 RepID=UPI0034540A5E